MACGGEGLHLPDGDLIEPFQPFALRQIHVDELGVHALDVGQHEQLLNGGVFAHVAFQFRIGVAPLPRGLAEQGHVEQVGFVGVMMVACAGVTSGGMRWAFTASV